MPAGSHVAVGLAGLFILLCSSAQLSSSQQLASRLAAFVAGTCASARRRYCRSSISRARTRRYKCAGVDTWSGLLLSTPKPVALV